MRREHSLLTLLALGVLVAVLLPSPAVLAVVLLSATGSIAIACSRAPLIAVLDLPAPSFSLTGQARVPSRRDHRIKQLLALWAQSGPPTPGLAAARAQPAAFRDACALKRAR